MSFLYVCFAGLLVPTFSFFAGRSTTSRTALMVATEVQQAFATTEAPDFYWQYRLERLISKKGSELAYNPKNYDVTSTEDLYNAYYLDLTMQGKMEKFDWYGEKDISDSEWLSIYKSISKWTAEVTKKTKLSDASAPKNDFDLLKNFYPNLDFSELESSFTADEVGANFPYKNMKELLGAAIDGTINVPGYSKTSVTTLEATEIKKELNALKEASMKRVDDVYAKVLEYANNPYPDETARKHYQELRKTLASFPQSPSEWKTYRANFEKELEEMAIMAAKKEDEHHHHDEHDENYISPAKAFEMKYGKNLDEMQERMNKYNSDPQGFLEASILEKFGKNGLDIWKKSQEFSAQFDVLSDAEKAKTEQQFSDFLKNA